MMPKTSHFLLLGLFGFYFENMTSSSSLQSRKTENILQCHGDVPIQSGPWPNNWSPWDFSNMHNGLHQLCAAYENDNQNVGCFCMPSTGIATCFVAKTESPELYYAFKFYCLSHCSCPETAIPGFGSNISTEEQEEAAAVLAAFENAESSGTDEEGFDWESALGYSRGSAEGEGLDWESALGYNPRDRSPDAVRATILNHRRAKKHRRLPSTLQECTGACSNAYSSCGLSPSCQCRASPINDFESGNPALYLSSCVSVLGGKVKRSVMDMPCPCNTTYVSHACCEASQGLVWEPHELKEGVLMVENVVN